MRTPSMSLKKPMSKRFTGVRLFVSNASFLNGNASINSSGWLEIQCGWETSQGHTVCAGLSWQAARKRQAQGCRPEDLDLSQERGNI